MKYSVLKVNIACSLLIATVGCSPALASAAPIRNKPIGPQNAADARPAEITAALEQFEAGKPDEAFELLQQASTQHPELPPPRVMLANMYFSENRPVNGRAELERAVLEHPTDPEAHLIFGDLAATERRWSDAELQYAEAARLLEKFDGPESRQESLTVQHLSGMALIAEGRAQWDIAKKFLTRLLGVRPAQPGAQQRLAAARYAEGDADGAFAGLQQAAKSDKKALQAELTMAQISQRAGKPDDAKSWLERAVAALPNDVRPHVALASLLWNQGDLSAADEHARAAEKLDAKSNDVKYWRGVILRYLGKSDEAQRYLEQVVQSAPEDFQAASQLAALLAGKQKRDEQQRALKLAQLNAKAAPRSAEAAATLGWAHLRLGQVDEAERLFKLAASSGNISRDGAYYMAVLAQQRGRADEARDLVGRAISSEGPFAYQKEAQQLQSALQKKK